MEFGVMIQTQVFAHDRLGDAGYEHAQIMRDLEVGIAADRAGFKYVAATEHHFLDEYSHLSANDVILSYLAHATEQIHLLSAIFNPLPNVIHPAKLAEIVAMLDHVSEGRFEFGTGRGAGSHEILGFLGGIGMEDLSRTREIWDDVIAEFPKMWLQDEYPGYAGKYWQLPPRKILPKPYGPAHPPMWYAAGNTSSYEMCARKGLGVLGFSVGSLPELDPVITSYKRGIANAEPIGAFINDSVLVASAACIDEDPTKAIEQFCHPNRAYYNSNVYRYHDTFPRPPEVPPWPELLPTARPEDVPAYRDAGMIIGDPDHALEQCRRWESAGVDVITFGVDPADHAATLRMIELMGEHVIPKLDQDPVHRTTKMRHAAG
jgi:alkanesulfonate monooxygenase SsuD/methylene tetrahydromethanopterin reductase-like flavin-dependent oxidoreductase (luciferase family)